MGVRVIVRGFAPDEATGEKATKAAYEAIAKLDAIMSDYRKDSELMLLNTEAKPLSPELLEVLARSQEVAELSDGAFDVTCGPLSLLWREARKTKKLPDPARLAEARSRVGWKNLVLDNGTARHAIPGMKLDLGGIAKGYACDVALDALRANGVDRALVEAGGDMAASGAPPGKLGWLVEVRNMPERRFWLRNGALSTSGDSQQFVIVGGKRYSHILDPRTGVGLTNRVQVTVIAPKGLVTDPLATALSVLGPERSVPLLQRYGATAYWVKEKGR